MIDKIADLQCNWTASITVLFACRGCFCRGGFSGSSWVAPVGSNVNSNFSLYYLITIKRLEKRVNYCFQEVGKYTLKPINHFQK